MHILILLLPFHLEMRWLVLIIENLNHIFIIIKHDAFLYEGKSLQIFKICNAYSAIASIIQL